MWFFRQRRTRFRRASNNMFLVYLLQSIAHHKYYIGCTDNIEKRLKEHNAGKTKSIKAFIPYKLIGFRQFSSKTDARKYEIHLKKNYQARREFITAVSSNG
jgi:putative endonuclease